MQFSKILVVVQVIFLLFATSSFSQLTNTLDKTKAQLSNIINGVTVPNKAYWEDYVYQRFVEFTTAFLERGYSANDFASLAAAINRAETDTALVVVSTNESLTATDTLRRTAALWVYKGGTISLGSGVNFLVQGHFFAGRYKVFEGSGTVTFADGSVDEIFPEWWGAASDSSTASLAALNSALSSITTGGMVNLADGKYLVTDSINISNPISIRGNTPPRRWTMTGSNRTSAITGADIATSNNSSANTIRISSRGVNLSDLTVQGDSSKSTGVGIRLAFTGSNTTLGANVLQNVHSGYHGSDGFRWECPDNSSMMIDCDANINRGYGIKVKAISGFSGGPGIGFTMLGGRTRRNGLGGLNIDSQLNATIISSGFIADTTYGVLISGADQQNIRPLLMAVDAEQQVVKAGAFPATSLRLMDDVRQGLFINNFLGVSTGVAGTTVRRRVSLGGTVRSSLWINNTFSGTNTTTSDTAVVVENGATVHALWIGDNGYSAAFDPIDSARVLGSGAYRAAWIGIDHNNTGGEFWIKSNKETEFTVKGTSADTLFIDNVSGVTSIDGDAGLDLNPSADAGVTMFKNSAAGENRTFRIYGDSAGTPRYLQLQIESSSGRAGFTHQTDQLIVMRSPLGIASTSYINFVERSALPSTPPATNGILSYKSDNHLWAVNDTGDSTDLHITQNIGDTLGVVLTAPGAATVARNGMNMVIDTFGAAASDTVVTLTGKIGDIVYIRTRNSGRDLTFLDSGNFSLGAERVLSNVTDRLVLLAITTTTWVEISFSDND